MTTFTAQDPQFAQKVAASFAAQSMMETMGATLSSVEPGAVTITSTIPDGALQQQGAAHAGLTFSIGDSAAGFAALSLMPPDQEVVTSEIGIHLLAPAMGDHLVAKGRVLRLGRRQIISEAEVWAETGADFRLVAKLIGTMVPVPLIRKDPT